MKTNPYQPPADVADRCEQAGFESVWRDGNLLVVTDESTFRSHCVFCNRSGATGVRITLVQHPKLTMEGIFRLVLLATFGVGAILTSIYLFPNHQRFLLLVSVLAAAAWILVVMLRTKDKLKLVHAFPLCTRHRILLVYPWGMSLLGLAIFVSAFFSSMKPFASRLSHATLVIVLLSTFRRHLVLSKHHDGVYWISGCGKKFLAELDPWASEEGTQ